MPYKRNMLHRARCSVAAVIIVMVFFLPLETRLLITDTRDPTGLVAHRNHCVRISAVWSNVVALGCAVARATRSCSRSVCNQFTARGGYRFSQQLEPPFAR